MTAPSAAEARADSVHGSPIRTLFAQRSFRRLWLGQSLSTFGDRLVMVALPLLAAHLTGSVGDVGLVIAAVELGLLVGLGFGGVIGDRFSRRKIMLVADLARAGVHGTVALLLLAGSLQIPVLVVLEVVFGVAQGVFVPAFAGLVPQTVHESQIQAATALTRASQYAAMLLGPAFAGVLAALGSLGVAFALDAVSFLASAAFLAALSVTPSPDSAHPGLFAELRAGLALVRAQRWVWSTIVCFALVAMLSVGPYTVLGPFLAATDYGSQATFGLITAALGAGTLTGALAGLRWRPPRTLVVGCAAAAAWPLLLLALAVAAPLGVTAASAVFAGAGLALFSVWWESALAQRIPNQSLSRVAALDWMGSLALLPLGCVLAAQAADVLGSPATVALGAGGALAALAWAAGANRAAGLEPVSAVELPVSGGA